MDWLDRLTGKRSKGPILGIAPIEGNQYIGCIVDQNTMILNHLVCGALSDMHPPLNTDVAISLPTTACYRMPAKIDHTLSEKDKEAMAISLANEQFPTLISTMSVDFSCPDPNRPDHVILFLCTQDTLSTLTKPLLSVDLPLDTVTIDAYAISNAFNLISPKSQSSCLFTHIDQESVLVGLIHKKILVHTEAQKHDDNILNTLDFLLKRAKTAIPSNYPNTLSLCGPLAIKTKKDIQSSQNELSVTIPNPLSSLTCGPAVDKKLAQQLSHSLVLPIGLSLKGPQK